MPDRPPQRRLQDPDEWFGEYDWSDPLSAPETRRSRPGEPPDEWVADEPRRRARRVTDVAVTVRTLLVGGGAAAVVLLLIGLAVAGVFSGSGSPARRAGTSTPAATTTPAAPTTTGTAATRPRPPLAPTTTLKPGDTGEQVKRLQRALARLGDSPGGIDGSYGPATLAAVKRFQDSSRLTADGVVGTETLHALQRALRALR